MKNRIDAIARVLPVLVMGCALAVISAQPAAAQKADKLKCRACLTSKQIENGKIKGKDLKDNAITSSKIAPNAVNSGKIADGTVGNADLAADAVTSDKVADGAIGNADLAADAVDGSKVAADSLTAADLATDSVTAAEISANAVTASEIADDAVTAGEIAPDAVGSSEVIGDSIPSADLQNEAGADFDGQDEVENVTDVDETVRSVSITAPAAGLVIVMASGTWDENGNPTTGRCSITTLAVVDETAMQQSSLGNEADEDRTPFALTRGFAVGAGTTTFNLVCDVTSAGGNANIEDAQMTAMYFPTQY